MGQATLDLPDPLQQLPADQPDAPPSPAMASADDLLSQLAGDDIDRLLAEAHAEQDLARKQAALAAPAPATVEPTANSVAAAVPAVEDEAALAALLNGSNRATASADAAPVVDSQAVSEAVETSSEKTEIHSGLEQVVAEPAPQAIPEPPPAPVAEQVPPVAAVVEVPAIEPAKHVDEPHAIDAEVNAKEREALAAAVQTEEPAHDDPDVEIAIPDGAVDHVSLLVRILEWLNYPLMLCSDEVREGMGKVALLTLFNSIAVLVYVLLFRKHPHH